MNQINIGVSGPAGSGKSTIVEIIHSALKNAGFTNILINDSDSNPNDLNRRINSLQDHGIKIGLGTHQTIRTLHGAD